MNRRIARVAALAATLLLAVALGAVPATAATKGNAVDRAFVRQMVPHHELAVEMARMAETQADHQQIKTLAASIIRSQSREIRRMKAIARGLGVRRGDAMSMDHMRMEDADTLGMSMDDMGMDMDMHELDGAKPFDRAFIDAMIPHHQGAIRMARAELRRGTNAQLRAIARAIIASQAKEIRRMNAWRKAWYGKTSPAGGVPNTR